MKQGARSPVVRGTGAFACAAPSGNGDGRRDRRPYVRFARTYGVTRVDCDDVPEHCGRSDGRAASGGGREGRASSTSTTPTPVTTASTINASWVPSSKPIRAARTRSQLWLRVIQMSLSLLDVFSLLLRPQGGSRNGLTSRSRRPCEGARRSHLVTDGPDRDWSVSRRWRYGERTPSQ